MKKGFTLLELVVVIIIIGVLATLGITQYGRMIERARGAEARTIAGAIRSAAAGYRIANNTCVGFTVANAAGIGTGTDQIPGAPIPAIGIPVVANCRATNYFVYGITAEVANGITIQALRCTGGAGKTPTGSTAGTLTLAVDFVLGTDTWGGSGGY